MGKIVANEPCPKCQEQGKDKGEDNLKRYVDNSAYCFSCGYFETSTGANGMQEIVTLPRVSNNSENGWRTRAISRDVMDRFSVFRVASDETVAKEDGTHDYKPTATLLFPYHDVETGELIGYKTRDLSVEKKHGIRWHGDATKMSLFGIGSQPKHATTVVLVEGEPDALALATVNKDVAVYAIPGAEHTEKVIKRAFPLINTYKRIVLLLDNDEPGKRATEKALSILPKSKLFVANLPANYKDVGEMVQAGLTSEVNQLVKNAKQVMPPAIVDDYDLLKEYHDAYNGIDGKAGISYGFRSLDEASGGMHGGELITIVAGTGAGKSTFTEKLSLNVADQGYNVFFCPLEMMPREVIKKMVQHKSSIPVARPDFKRNEFTDKKLAGVAEAIVERVKFMSHFGGMDIESFLTNCEAAIAMYEVKVIVVDHLTALVTASAGGNNVFASDNITSRLKEFALKHDVTIIAISHVSRDSGYDVENKVPQLKHLRGGNGVAQYSDFVIGLGRKRSEKTTDIETIKLHRMVGEHRAFKLIYQNYTLLELVDDSLEPDTEGVEERWTQEEMMPDLIDDEPSLPVVEAADLPSDDDDLFAPSAYSSPDLGSARRF